MTASPRHRLPLQLLLLLMPDEQPLAGDLCEAAHTRSTAWLWRQVLLAIPIRLLSALRARPRATAETALVSTALLVLLGFYAVVVASLLNHLLVLNDIGWVTVTGRYHAWQAHSTVPAFLVAVAIGRAAGSFHRDHRVAAVLLLAASATAAAFLNLLLFVPDVLLRPFVPSAALQTAISMLFIAGLFVGLLAARSAARKTLSPRCEPLSSSLRRRP
jgi:hypothetical protein